MFSCLLSSPLPPPPPLSCRVVACRLAHSGTRPLLSSPLSSAKFLNVVYEPLVGLLPCNRRIGSPLIGVGRSSKSSNAKRQEDSDEDDEVITDIASQTAIKHSKKARERKLQQQIVQRRKLVLSIQDSVVTKEKEPASYSRSHLSVSNLDIRNTEELDRTNNSRTSSDRFATLTEADLVSDEEEHINGLEVEKSMADALELRTEANLEQCQPHIMIPVRSDDSKSYVRKDKISTETNIHGSNLTNGSWTSSDSLLAQSTEAGVADDEEKLANGLEVEQSTADALELLTEANLDQSQVHIMLPVLSDESKSYVMEDENLEISTETNIQGSDLSNDSWNSSNNLSQSTEAGVKPIHDLEVQQAMADSLGLSAEAYLEQSILPVQHDECKSFVRKDKNLEFSAETKIQGSNEQQEVMPEETNLESPPLAGQNVMNVIVVAAECAPWSKTGGLGDVVDALPKALARRGHRVMVVSPRYGNYAESKEVGVLRRYKADGQDLEVTYYHAYIDSVDFVFIDSPVFRHIENNIYGGNRREILKRMVLFCRAAIEVPWHVPCGGTCYGDGNLVFVANDWHTALLPVYLKTCYRYNGLMIYARSVLVIHNIAYQGRGPLDDFACVDLPDHDLDLFKHDDPVGGEHFNILKAGLRTADRVVTVSHGYAWELKTPEGGWGLHDIINENSWKFQGIINGINTECWNPKFDVHLTSDGYTNYRLETLQEGKAQCKAALQRELGLSVRVDVPIIAFIGRLDGQKGVDLIAEAMPWLAGQDMQLIMLGTGRPDLQDLLRKFEREHHDKIRGWVGFSVKMAHRITAGADILLMPSRFEPCGLNQLYAMMYGTVPVVHAVGGLRDTVQPFDPNNDTGLGWTFERAETNRMIDALGHCLNTYRNYKKSWEGLQVRGMTQDLGWDKAAQRYEEVLVAAKYQW